MTDAGEVKQKDPSSNSVGAKLTQNAGSGNSSPVMTASTGKRPPIDRGDLGMQIARDGTWFYLGSPIGRLPLVKLFASVLRREADGRYWLVTPAERGRVEVEDVPFVAVAVTVEGEGRDQRLIFRTNLDEFVTAGPDNPLRVETAASGEAAPYILVRDGLEARDVMATAVIQRPLLVLPAPGKNLLKQSEKFSVAGHRQRLHGFVQHRGTNPVIELGQVTLDDGDLATIGLGLELARDDLRTLPGFNVDY